MAFPAVWSLDIGRCALKAVHLRRYGSHVGLLGADRIEYDIGPEGVDHIGGAREALQIFTSRHTIRDPVVVALPGHEALSRFIKIVADDEKKLAELVNYEARQQIPFDIESVVWDWVLVPRQYVAGQEKEVGIFASRRETVDDLLLDLESYGITAQMIVPSYLGLLNYVLYELRPRVPSVVLDIGGEGTSLLLVEDGGFWIRQLPFSGSTVTRTLRGRFKLTFAEAERLKKQAARSSEAVKIFTALRGIYGDLVSDVQTSLGFYRAQVNEATFKHLYLMGHGSYSLGLGRLLKERLGMRVLRVNSLGRMRAEEGADVSALRPQLPGLGAAMGVGLQAVGLGRTSVDLMPREQQVQLAFARRRKLVFVAGAVMLLVLFFLGNYYGKLAARAGETLAAAQKEIKDREDIEKDMPGEYDMALIRSRLAALAKVGQERHFFDGVLRAVYSVFATVMDAALEDAKGEVSPKYRPLGEGVAGSIFAVPASDETAGKAEAQKFIEAAHKEAAWIVSLQVKLQGEEEEGARRGSLPSRQAQAAEKKERAYEFLLTGAIRSRETPQASQKAVQEKIIDPLGALLAKDPALKGFIVSPPKAVTMDNFDSSIPALTDGDRQFNKAWHLLDPRDLKRLLPSEEERSEEEAGPVNPQAAMRYYLFQVRWLVGEGTPAESQGEGPDVRFGQE